MMPPFRAVPKLTGFFDVDSQNLGITDLAAERSLADRP